MLGNLLGGFVIIVIGVTLLPTVANSVAEAQGGNVTGTSSTILGLTTLFYSLAIMTAALAIAAQGLRASGMIGV